MSDPEDCGELERITPSPYTTPHRYCQATPGSGKYRVPMHCDMFHSIDDSGFVSLESITRYGINQGPSESDA